MGYGPSGGAYFTLATKGRNTRAENLGVLPHHIVLHPQPYLFGCIQRQENRAAANELAQGANNYAKTFQEAKGLTTLNYFLPQCGVNGITQVEGYNRLFTPNIYPNIDLHYYSNTFGLKMYFVVKPNTDGNNIVLNIAGANNATVKELIFLII